MTIPFRVTETIRDSNIEELVKKYPPEEMTLQGENLLTLYINSRNKHHIPCDLKILMHYPLQERLIKNSFFADGYIYEYIFSPENFDILYKEKFFPGLYPNDSYWALTLPLNCRFDLFQKLYREQDSFISTRFDIMDDLFKNKRMMHFNDVDTWHLFHEKLEGTLGFLLQEKKIRLCDLDNIGRLEKSYSKQVFDYYRRHRLELAAVEAILGNCSPSHSLSIEDVWNKIVLSITNSYLENNIALKSTKAIVKKI